MEQEQHQLCKLHDSTRRPLHGKVHKPAKEGPDMILEDVHCYKLWSRAVVGGSHDECRQRIWTNARTHTNVTYLLSGVDWVDGTGPALVVLGCRLSAVRVVEYACKEDKKTRPEACGAWKLRGSMQRFCLDAKSLGNHR